MTAASDLILASFDLLATSVFRNEIQKEAHLLKSFLINKVPLLLSQLLPPQFSGNSTEEVVKKTLDQVDQSLFPTASAMFDQSRNSNPYTESIREEFCASCVLHGLVSRDHLEQILGEDFMSNDAREKYSKEKLVGDCLADPERIRSLVGEIDKMDGNVGAVCQAIVEVIRQLCNGKETMTLKLVCSQLAQKPQALDVLLLFEKLPTVLEPLCILLDNWRYEEDQGEYQPVYEEYGAVLLLVLAFAYRYQLVPTDVGSQLPDGAVATILARAHVAREVQELTEKEKEHLNGWIQGLFDSDTGGLGDELMSSCPPKDFYLLIATLFYNTVAAYTHGHLSDESLKSGIECKASCPCRLNLREAVC
jgi:mediator of RNA polymerase II transcription subunit 5